MSDRSSVLFMSTGRPSPRFLALWRAKGVLPQAALPYAAELVSANGEASSVFRSLWRMAFVPAAGAVLPREAIAEPSGKATDGFWDAFDLAVAAT